MFPGSPGIDRAGAFDQQGVAFCFGNGFVLDSPGDHNSENRASLLAGLIDWGGMLLLSPDGLQFSGRTDNIVSIIRRRAT